MSTLSCSTQIGDMLVYGGDSAEFSVDAVSTRLLVMWCSLFSMVGLLIIGIFLHYYWRAKSRQMSRMTLSKSHADDVSKILVRTFAPKLAIQTYQFRGMRPKNNAVSISFKELGLVLRNGATVLDGVTGSFQAGQLVALMGPSGAGKTSFLNVLCGKASYGTMKGEVWINGDSRDIQDLKPVTGFVPQDDIVYENLTVREHLEYSAWLRTPRGTSPQIVRGIVDDVLHVMQLEHVQLSLVGSVESRGVSGGQRKRVNIGLELAASPSLIFLDEPTSGLDATSSLQILSSLSKMTQLGMTIIMTIHQPRYSLFQLFDSVLLLGMGGRTVYAGSADGAVPHFVSCGFEKPQTTENPADWLMDVISGQVANVQHPDFEPRMLCKWWDPAATATAGAKKQTININRSSSLQETSQDLKLSIDVHWKKIAEKNGSASCEEMDETAFSSFLHHLMGHQVDMDVVREVMARISFGDTSVLRVRKASLQEYLLRMGDTVPRHDYVMALKGLDGDKGWENAAVHVGDVVNEVAEQVGGLADAVTEAIESRWRTLSVKTKKSDGDLSRQSPAFTKQFRLEIHRRLVQYWRETTKRLIDLALVLVLSAATALLFRERTDEFIAALMFQLGIAFITNISSLRVFADKTVCWRENASGTNMFALFFARTTVHAMDVLLQVVVYVSLYYVIALPAAPFEVYLVPCVALATVTSGWGYLMSTLLTQNATMASTLTILLVCGLLGEANIIQNTLNNGFLEFLISLTVSRWSMQIFLGWNIDKTGGIPYPEAPCDSLSSDSIGSFMEDLGDYRLQHSLYDHYATSVGYSSMGFVGSGILILLMQSLLLRILGYSALKHLHGSKRM